MGNREYLQGLVDQITSVPTVAAAILATEIYKGAVLQTHIDSGQAALNWHISPYVSEPTFEGQEMLWGYGSVAPSAPAGFKWAKGSNVSRVRAYLFEQGVSVQLALENEDFTGIAIYNPITPGFPGFAPGNDENYEHYALGEAHADIAQIISAAQAEMEERIVSEYSFVRSH